MPYKLKKLGNYADNLDDLLKKYVGQELKSVNLRYGQDIVLEIGATYLVLSHDQSCCESVDFVNNNPVLAEYELKTTSNKPHVIKDINVDYTSFSVHYDTELTTIHIELNNQENEYDYIILQLQWFGSSNGYYSTTVDLFELVETENGDEVGFGEQIWPKLS